MWASGRAVNCLFLWPALVYSGHLPGAGPWPWASLSLSLYLTAVQTAACHYRETEAPATPEITSPDTCKCVETKQNCLKFGGQLEAARHDTLEINLSKRQLRRWPTAIRIPWPVLASLDSISKHLVSSYLPCALPKFQFLKVQAKIPFRFTSNQ